MILLQMGGQGNFSFYFLMAAVIVFMYFFMIRPQQKKQKDQLSMVDGLKAGDDIVTAGGLHGKVMSKDDATVTISAGGGAKLTFDKAAIAKKL